MINPK